MTTLGNGRWSNVAASGDNALQSMLTVKAAYRYAHAATQEMGHRRAKKNVGDVLK